jgi:hypothetical protein
MPRTTRGQPTLRSFDANVTTWERKYGGDFRKLSVNLRESEYIFTGFWCLIGSTLPYNWRSLFCYTLHDRGHIFYRNVVDVNAVNFSIHCEIMCQLKALRSGFWRFQAKSGSATCEAPPNGKYENREFSGCSQRSPRK